LLRARASPAPRGDLWSSPSTVGTYRSRIMGKLGIKNNADLVRYALKNKLIE
jgi:DNA-binding NarL/FixJ family response regulator